MDNRQVRLRLVLDLARRGQAICPQDEPVDSPFGVHGLPTAPRTYAYGLTRFACQTASFKGDRIPDNQKLQITHSFPAFTGQDNCR